MRPIITLTTDFGAGAYVAQMKGVILSICPEATLVDVDHEVPPQDLVAAAWRLRDVVSTFPPGTVHVVVVDPGVGTKRRGVVVKAGVPARGHYFVGPDNGVFGEYALSGEMRLLPEPSSARPLASQTFHGRDVFAPAAAHLGNGKPFESFGPVATEPVVLEMHSPLRLENGLVGEVLYADRFGNLVTNILAEDLPPAADEDIRVEIGWARIDGLSRTYGDVRIDDWVALVGSSGRLEIAVREGSAHERLQISQVRGLNVSVKAVRRRGDD